VGWVAAVALVYFGSAKLGLTLAFATPSVTAVWPPTGIALAALVLGGRRLWPGVALGAFLANVTTDVPVATALGITIGNTLEALVGASLLRMSGFRPDLRRLRDILALLVLGGALSTLVAATIGIGSLALGDALPDDVLSAWRVWWLGDMGGDLLVASLLMIAVTHWPYREAPGRLAEALLLACGLVAVALVVFSHSAGTAYLTFPFLAWAALRFFQPGAIAAAFVVGTLAVAFTAHGSGQFVQSSEDDSLLLAQTFAAVSGLSALLLATVMGQRTRAERRAIEIASALQGELLPATLPEISGMQTAAWYRPGMREQEAGGDFYDVFEDGGGAWIAVIGDACGKGPEAASLTALARHTVRASANRPSEPSVALELLNKAILEQRTDRRFMTVAMARVTADGENAFVTVSNGGHPTPLLVRADGEVEEVGAPGTLLGIYPDPRLTDQHATMGTGDALVLFTDGLSESRDPSDDAVGRIRRTLEANAGASATEIVTSLQHEAERRDGALTDDVAILVLAQISKTREPPADSITLDLPPIPESAAAARAAVARFEARLDYVAYHDLRLLVSELVTNSVRHAGLSAEQPIQLCVALTDETLRLEVSDPGHGFEPRAIGPADRAGGWGLYIAEQLADRWGVERTAGQTRVWIERDLGPSEGPT
jgi:integral membrane sensor domain MASE1/anti-sigma regulatory factor (Ser/Thr protein kinase)